MVNECEQYERKELIKFDDKFFLVSRVLLTETTNDWETMIFASNSRGEIDNWSEEYVYNGYESIIDTVIRFIGKDRSLSDVEGDLD